MRSMARRAIVSRWRVFPQEWTTFLRMTLEARIIDGCLQEQSRPLRPVRIVTIRARHRGLVHGMVGPAAEFSALFRMARKASGGLPGGLQNMVRKDMDLVAGNAANLDGGVTACVPVYLARGVAIEARLILGTNRIVLLECHVGSDAGRSAEVINTWPVTTFADAPLPHGRGVPMRRAKNNGDRFDAVASQTDIFRRRRDGGEE